MEHKVFFSVKIATKNVELTDCDKTNFFEDLYSSFEQWGNFYRKTLQEKKNFKWGYNKQWCEKQN